MFGKKRPAVDWEYPLREVKSSTENLNISFGDEEKLIQRQDRAPVSITQRSPSPATDWDLDLVEAHQVMSPETFYANEHGSELEERNRFILKIVVSIAVVMLIGIGSLMLSVATMSSNGKRLPGAGLGVDASLLHKNVILMISDGFGFASLNAARTFYQQRHNLTYSYQLPLDTMLRGSIRTRSHSSLVTDSAAGATAFSCGIKTNNTEIGMDPRGEPCGTTMESAHERDYLTGLVTTSRITHATPASFNAHVPQRDDEEEILLQQLFGYRDGLNASVDFMFGGGSCLFQDCRKDGRNIFEEALRSGWRLITNRPDFDALDTAGIQLPLVAVFAPEHLSFELDREPSIQPSLAEMTMTSLNIAKSKLKEVSSYKGFFVMIEGSRIDMAAHANDPAAHVWEVIAYNEAIQVAKSFVDNNPGTILISVSDHETGGLAVGRQLDSTYPDYKWTPGALNGAKKSIEIAHHELKSILKEIKKKENRNLDYRDYPVVEQYLLDNFGISTTSYYAVTTEDVAAIINTVEDIPDKYPSISYALGDLISKNAEIGWSTHGHSAVDIGLYVYDGSHPSEYKPLEDKTFLTSRPGFPTPTSNPTIRLNADDLKGNIENTFISTWVSEYLNLSVQEITKKLN